MFSCVPSALPCSKGIPVLSSWVTFFSALYFCCPVSPSCSWMQPCRAEQSRRTFQRTYRWHFYLYTPASYLSFQKQCNIVYFCSVCDSQITFFVSTTVLCPVFEPIVVLTYVNTFLLFLLNWASFFHATKFATIFLIPVLSFSVFTDCLPELDFICKCNKHIIISSS